MGFNIIFFLRKARKSGNYSIETYFGEVIKLLPNSMQAQIKISKYESVGFWKRLYITVEAIARQGDINHITGDIHFLTLFLKKKRTILTIHDCWFMHHPSFWARFVFKFIWLKLPIWRSAMVTTVSEATKSEVIFYTGCNPDKIRVINTFVPLEFVAAPKVFNKQNPIILHIGTVENKNLERLIPALNGINCTLNIIGQLSKVQIELLNYHKIQFRNSFNITNEEIRSAYINSDIVAFVSTFEGFGMPIVEGNRTERVVVTSNISSMPEVAGDSACFVDPYDVNSIRNGILKVISDDSYRENLIDNGRKNRNRFLPEKIADKYYQLYIELLNLVN